MAIHPGHPDKGSSLHDLSVAKAEEWLGVKPDSKGKFNCRILTGVSANAQESEILAAVDERLTILSAHLDGPDHDVVQHLMHMVESAGAKLIQQLKQVPVVSRQTETFDALTQALPKTILEKREPHSGFLSALRQKKLPLIGAGVVGGVAALFGLLKQHGETPSMPNVTEERSLPPDAPELQPPSLSPSPAPAAAKEQTAPPKPEPKHAQPVKPVLAQTTPANLQKSVPATKDAPLTSSPATEEKHAPANPETRNMEQKRLPIPDTTSLEQHSDLSESPTLRTLGPKRLLEQSRAVQNPSERWMLLCIALQQAQNTHDLDDIMAVRQEFKRVFDVTISPEQEMEAKMKAIRDATKQRGGVQTEVVMRHIFDVVRELFAQDQYDAARSFLSELRNRPSVDRRQIMELVRLAARFKNSYERQNVSAAAQTMHDQPNDPDANRTVGMFRCFEQGNWNFTRALHASGDPLLQALAKRVECRATLSAPELLKLARDIIEQSPSGPGASAMALECCALAEPQTKNVVLKALIKDLSIKLAGQNPIATLSFFHDTQVGPLNDAGLAHVRNAVTRQTAGIINLLGEDPRAAFEKKHIVRGNWQVATMENGKECIQGVSGHQSSASAINFPLSTASRETINKGQYALRFVFQRTPGGRWPNAIHGTTACVIPLPNKETVSFFWDDNMNKNAPGVYRSGFDIVGTSFFEKRNDRSAFADHQNPIIAENNTPYVCIVTVQTLPQEFLITAQIAALADQKPLASFTLRAPLTVKGHSTLLHMDGAPPPPKDLGNPWGMGVAGGTLQLLDAEIAPLSQQVTAKR